MEDERELYLTDEDIHGLEEDSEIIELTNKVDNLKEKVEEQAEIINLIKEKVENDIRVNESCLKEKTSAEIVQILNIQINYDKELLEIINEE